MWLAVWPAVAMHTRHLKTSPLTHAPLLMHTRLSCAWQAAYCASKGALVPLAKSLAIAWAKDNIQARGSGVS